MFEDYYSGVTLYSGVNKIDTKGKRHSSKVPITDTSVWRILEEGEQVVLNNNANHKNPTVINCQVEVVEGNKPSFFISYYCYSLLFVSGLSTSSTKALYKPIHCSSANRLVQVR